MDHALDAAPLPPGAIYITEFLSREEEAIKDRLDAGEWSNTLKRRVRHFGYLYDYRARAVTADAYLGKRPPWLETDLSPQFPPVFGDQSTATFLPVGTEPVSETLAASLWLTSSGPVE